MFKRVLRLVAFGLAFFGYGIVCGQSQSNQGKLAFVIPNLYGPGGLRLDNPDHDSHFAAPLAKRLGP